MANKVGIHFHRICWFVGARNTENISRTCLEYSRVWDLTYDCVMTEQFAKM